MSHDNHVLDDDIKNAKKAIEIYMHFFQEKFPEEPVTPKQHMLEAHVPMWLRRWKFGMSLHGEQGVEQTHAVVNTLKVRVRDIKKKKHTQKKQRIDTLVKEHCLVTEPCIKIELDKET